MSGPPTIKIDLKQKDGDRRVDICALWKGRGPGQYSGKFQVYDKESGESVDVVKLKLADGRAITLEEWWVNAMHWDEYKAAQSGGDDWATPEPETPFEDNEEDDIPF